MTTELEHNHNINATEMFELNFRHLTNNLTRWNRTLSGFEVTMERVPSPFYFNTFLPTLILTLISFLGFVIPVEKVPGRTALLVTIFLMLVNISSTEKNRGPVVKTHAIACTVSTSSSTVFRPAASPCSTYGCSSAWSRLRWNCWCMPYSSRSGLASKTGT